MSQNSQSMRRSSTLNLSNANIKESNVGWLNEKILKLDIFYQDIEILFDNGKPKLQTHCGVILGFLILTILFAYGYMKANIMV